MVLEQFPCPSNPSRMLLRRSPGMACRTKRRGNYGIWIVVYRESLRVPVGIPSFPTGSRGKSMVKGKLTVGHHWFSCRLQRVVVACCGSPRVLVEFPAGSHRNFLLNRCWFLWEVLAFPVGACGDATGKPQEALKNSGRTRETRNDCPWELQIVTVVM